jgi:hypothetical protein
MRSTAAAIVLILVSLSGSAAQRQTGSPAVITPVLGHWTTAMEAGGAVVTADATKWNGQPPAALEGLAKALFGGSTVNPAFRTNVTSEGAFPLAVFNDITTFTAGTVRLEFKLIGGETDQIAGLVFDLRPTGEYLYVRYNTRDDNVALWRFANGQRSVVAHGTAHRRLAMNEWHPLVLTVRDRTLRATAAGDLSVDHTLDRPVSGRVGAWTKRDSITAFRRWRIE